MPLLQKSATDTLLFESFFEVVEEQLERKFELRTLRRNGLENIDIVVAGDSIVEIIYFLFI